MYNLPLRGLYWIAKDFFPVFNSIIEPKSKVIRDIRNHLEHKYVKTVIYKISPDKVSGDKLAYYLTTEELLKHTLTLLKLSRDAIIYLIMEIHVEENFREKTRKKDIIPFPMKLYGIDEEWKL
ncbi:LA2681 family HEPN domain-containing protein [Bacillus sp. SB49]|uniref:LA2681 family HEPN domain-containing protein n=1 Tax=Bacillus sp. SB49 TaxID=1071080 RepID=UPI0022A6B3C5|nr:LA2681 family HEPN domain-containing protein [Bacillus sp. SB49]